MNKVLSAEDFEVLAEKGLGRDSNAVAHSMVEFEGRLYVGTTVPAPRENEALPRIVVFDPKTGEWETAYESDFVDCGSRAHSSDVQLLRGDGPSRRNRQQTGSTILPCDFGYRSMIVYQGKSDKKPCLYATSMSLLGGRILRSEDGQHFESVAEPGLGNSEVLSFRSLTEVNGKLYTAPVGTINDEFLDRNMAPESLVYVTSDPASGKWEVACEPCLGDTNNESIFALGACGDYLYAGTGNPKRGFQVWRTKGAGKAPFKWECILDQGAYRYGLNFSAASLIEFNGALYIGGGITGFGYDKPNDIGPAAAEMIRVNEDGSWDLIFGEARFTPDGLKIPLAGAGPGLDDPYDSVTWSMAVHDGALYFGTHNWKPFSTVSHTKESRPEGGYNVWGSADGEDWSLVLTGQDSNPCETGVRTLCSTKDGLYVGTFNHTRLVRVLGALHGYEGNLDEFSDGFSVLRGA